MLTRKDIERFEKKDLASFAMRSRYSRGRAYPEKEHAYRSLYQRDRDRIIHCAAFRRLEYKTQVFVYHEGDYYRTRLTHTLEVSQIARTIAKMLALNEELTETIALAHDLGHTPFGHAVESVLDELMQDEGGFNHNMQGLRVVDSLEKRYPEFDGLNLSWEAREGIAKHSVRRHRSLSAFREFDNPNQPTMETQVMDIADEIAYDNHDIDDGIKSGLIFEEDLKKIKLWNIICKRVKNQYHNLTRELHVYLVIRTLINMQVTDLIGHTHKNIKRLGVRTHKDVVARKERIVTFSQDVSLMRQELRKFLYAHLYCHWRVLRMSDKAKRFIESLFNVYLKNPELLPPEFKQKIKKAKSIRRVVCDYVAGMTDRYALEEYKKLFDPYEKV